MHYLHIDDVSISLLCPGIAAPTLKVRNIMPGALDEVLADLAADTAVRRLDVLVSGPTTIVPSEEFGGEENVRESLFNSCFNFVDNTPRCVFDNEIPALYSHLLFGVKQSTRAAILGAFPQAEVSFVSALTPLLRHFSAQHDGSCRFRVYVNCRKGFVDVFVFDAQQLAVLNSFPVNTASDAVYYMIGFSKTVGIELSVTPYFIVGDSVMAADIVGMLKRFAPLVETRSVTDEFGASPLTLNTNISYDLAAHILCAS